jgi:hypothetical protein
MQRLILAVFCLCLFACAIPAGATAQRTESVDIVVTCQADKAWGGTCGDNSGASQNINGTGPGSHTLSRGSALIWIPHATVHKVSAGGWQLNVSIMSGSEVLDIASTTAELGEVSVSTMISDHGTTDIPGFPVAAVAVGIGLALASLISIRRRRTSS